MHPEAIGIMDTGMSINPDDLMAEVKYVENLVGDTRGKLLVSENAILNTDLDRAEEQLNRLKQGKSAGGTGRGISPSYAHHYDRLGLHIYDLVNENWRETLGSQYDRYLRELELYGLDLPNISVPDLAEIKRTGSSQTRLVGTKEEFLDRLETARTWLIDRKMVQNTYIIHKDLYQNDSQAVVIEMAQAVGLDPWTGTRPDVTSSTTSLYGLPQGTSFWEPKDIAERIGVFKLTYTSSVGARRMPTHANNSWAEETRNEAHEFGTTTGRPRDILYLDLDFLRYNIKVSAVEVLAGTHLDIAREDVPIRVATHYTKNGQRVPYQPGLQYQEDVEVHYMELPGWDGKACSQARSFEELPYRAQQYLSFIQLVTGYPIVTVTNGPERQAMIELPGYQLQH